MRLNDKFQDKIEDEVSEATWQHFIKSPSADDIWNRFKDKQSLEEVPKRSFPWGLTLKILGSAVACVVILILVLHPSKETTFEKEGVVITQNGNDISSFSIGSKVENITASTLDLKNAKDEIEGKPVTVTTARGKSIQITLPDSSTVWLNADSRLEYIEGFAGGTRTVKLSGEAFFDIKHDDARPFVVETETFKTIDISTQFNIKAYPKREASVIVAEGEVEVIADHGSESFKLHENTMAVISSEGTIATADHDAYPLIQWKDGLFYFNDEPLLDIMIEIGRWYNSTVIFEDETAESLSLHFVAERSDPLHDVIKQLNKLDGIEVELEENVIIVK